MSIKPSVVLAPSPGSAWLRDLYNYFEPVRDEAIAKGYSEDQINDAIDNAIAAVRGTSHTLER